MPKSVHTRSGAGVGRRFAAGNRVTPRSAVPAAGLLIALLAATPPGRAAAQDFTGTGQQATALFPLPAGLAVFELQHQGSGAYAFRLLDENGAVVQELAAGSGTFAGSKAIGVPRAGRYVFDVSATGPWSIHLRPASPAAGEAAGGATKGAPPAAAGTASAGSAPAGSPAVGSAPEPLPDSLAVLSPAERGRRAGVQAGQRAQPWSWKWFSRGLAGGTVAGPIGAGIATAAAGHGTMPDAPAVPEDRDPALGEGYRTGYASGIRNERREAALVGGLLGTGIFTFALLHVLNVVGGGAGTDDGGGQTTYLVVPLHVLR